MHENETVTIDLRDIFLLFKKNLLAMIAAAVVFAAIGGLYTQFLITPQYEADATLIVNSREDQSGQASITNDQITSATKLVNTYSVILTSDTVLNKTIADLGLDMTYQELVKKVSITSVNDTQVMKITVRDADPELAQQVAASIVEQAPDMIIQTVKAGSVEVISQAKVGQEPVSPSLKKNVAIAGIIGFLLCFVVFFIRHMLNNRFMTESDITNKLGLTVLGVIPSVEIPERKGEKHG